MATQQQLRDAAYAAGFRGADLDRIVAISLAESGGQESATANTSAEYSVGPLQINLRAGHSISEADARDPAKAMQYAYGLAYGTPQSWNHWSVYSNRSYQQFMPGGRDVQMTTCYDADFNEVSCDLPQAVYDSGFNKIDKTKQAAANYRGEALPGLSYNQADGRYYNPVTGQQATLDQVQSALDQKYPGGAPDGITAADLLSASVSTRGQDLSYAASTRGQDIGYAESQAQLGYSYANLGEQTRQFNEQQAFAKEQWLFQKQNEIDQLNLQREQLATTQAQNARMFTLEQQNLGFLQDKFAFESGIALRQEARATEAQLFGQQATVAGLQMEMVNIQSQVAQTNARIQSEVAMFNAGKEADVSMFNIDQQTKTAMFNAEGAYNAKTFNAQMGFEVQKANVENERLRQQQLIDVASRISEAAKDPGDRAALASLILALGSNSGFGGMDAALFGADLRTGDSTMPLEAMLRQREDILESERNPFKFDPVSWDAIAPPAAATFNPAQANLAPAPDFSGVKLPTPNTTPFDPSSIPTSAPKAAPTFDSTQQNYIASGNTTAPGEQFNVNGVPLTAEERAQIPDFVLRDLIATGQIPAMEEGGLFDQGTVTSLTRNVRTPFQMPTGQPGQRGSNPRYPRDGSGATSQQRYEEYLAQTGQAPAPPPAQRYEEYLAQTGQGQIPGQGQTGRMGDSPEFMDPQQLIAMLMQRFGDDPRFQGVRDAIGARFPAGMPGQGGGQPPVSPGQNWQWPANMPQMPNLPNGMPPSIPSIQPVGQGQQTPFMFDGPAGQSRPRNLEELKNWDTSIPHPGYFPQAEEGGMMRSAFVAGDSKSGKESEEIIIPLGPGMALVIPNKQTKKILGAGKAGKQPKKMAKGGLFQQQGNSMYEGLVNDTDRTRANNFLGEASRRATMGTPWDVNRLPTPVFASSPGTSRFVTDLLASLNAIRRGIPPEYFREQAARLTPAGYSEGVIGRTR